MRCDFLRSPVLLLALTGFMVCALPASSAVRFSAAASATAPVPRSQKHEFRRQILQLEQQWREALLRQDTQTLGQLLNSDYMGIGANGAIESRTETLQEIHSGTLRITELALSEQKVRIFRQTAVVTSVAELHGTDDDTLLDGRYRYTHVYVRDSDGTWSIASFEASRVQPRKHSTVAGNH